MPVLTNDTAILLALAEKPGITALEFIDRLDARGHERREAQWVVQRCIDRGFIVVGPGLRLSPGSLDGPVNCGLR